MNAFSFVFSPTLPKCEIFDSARKQGLKDLSHLDPAQLMPRCFQDTWDLLWLPDELVDPLEGFWPDQHKDCTTCYLWDFLANDILTASLVHLRRQVKTKSYTLSDLVNSISSSTELSSYSRNIQGFMPTILKELLGVSWTGESGVYDIQTPYPKLVRALIGNARNSCFSQNHGTRSSFKYNLRFINACFESIYQIETVGKIRLKGYPAEEIYFLERLFSTLLHILIHTDTITASASEYLISLTQQMPNVTTRFSLLKTLLSIHDVFPQADEIDFRYEEEDITSVMMKLIGGYIFPVWQWLFISNLTKQFPGEPACAIRAIETIPFYNAHLTGTDLLRKRTQIPPPRRSEQELYPKRFACCDIDWWADQRQALGALAGARGEELTARSGTLLFQSPLFDPYVLSSCVYSE